MRNFKSLAPYGPNDSPLPRGNWYINVPLVLIALSAWLVFVQSHYA